MTRKARKWLIWLGAAVVVAALAVVLWQPTEVVVSTALVAPADLQVTVQEQGRTRVRERYIVAAPVTGRLSRVALQAGDTVARGQVLARLAPPPDDPRVQATLRSALAVAEARASEVQAQLKEARSAVERTRREARRRAELHQQGLVSSETRDLYAQTASAARAHLASLQASLTAADAAVDSARAQLLDVDNGSANGGFITLRAPDSGRVLAIHEESERVVTAGTPLLEIGATQALEVVVDVLTQDAVQIKAGNPMLITGWGGPGVLQATVRQIEAAAFTKVSALGVEEQRVNVIADLAQTPATLGAGYRIEAAIVTWQGKDVLTVPLSAVFRRDQRWHAFVVDGDTARLRPVQLGRQSATHAQVQDGLASGERVIVYPSDLVADGVSVQWHD